LLELGVVLFGGAGDFADSLVGCQRVEVGLQPAVVEINGMVIYIQMDEQLGYEVAKQGPHFFQSTELYHRFDMFCNYYHTGKCSEGSFPHFPLLRHLGTLVNITCSINVIRHWSLNGRGGEG